MFAVVVTLGVVVLSLFVLVTDRIGLVVVIATLAMSILHWTQVVLFPYWVFKLSWVVLAVRSIYLLTIGRCWLVRVRAIKWARQVAIKLGMGIRNHLPASIQRFLPVSKCCDSEPKVLS